MASTTTLPASEVRDRFADVLNRVAYGSERVLIGRRGRELVALISVPVFRRLEELEARWQAALASRTLGEGARQRVREWSPTTLAVYQALVELATEEGYCTATNAEIAAQAGLRSESTVREWLGWLRKHRRIEVMTDPAVVPSRRRIRLVWPVL